MRFKRLGCYQIMNSGVLNKGHSYPIATHSYFKAINLEEEKNLFLKSNDYIPRFKYKNNFKEEIIKSRLEQLDRLSREYLSLSCVLSGVYLQSNDAELERFRQINKNLFGVPNLDYAEYIISRILNLKSRANDLYKKEITLLLGKKIESDINIGPSSELFLKYKRYFENYRVNTDNLNMCVSDAIKYELDQSELANKGWRLQLVDGSCHAHTLHDAKKIIIGRDYEPRTSMAANRIAIHEVYGHALPGKRNSIAESEGFALMLEQLLGKTFKFRRSYRYLAASLGWGILGKPMSFREVFEILWRLMLISSKYSESKAKECAFSECYRVFRGGRPDLAGAVFLKDIIYFDANIKIWNAISKKNHSYSDFVDIIEGRKTILK